MRVIFALLLLGCAKETVTPPIIKEPEKEEVKLPKIEDITKKYRYTYHYRSKGRRDPFASLLLEGAKVPESAYMVKGIIWDDKERVVLIRTGGRSLLLKGGVLYDEEGKKVPGIKGYIEGRSVVLIKGGRKIRIPSKY
jgi:hypothetical protein